MLGRNATPRADVCWEVYAPEEPFFAVSGFRLNSACHVWSAGAAWFLRMGDRSRPTMAVDLRMCEVPLVSLKPADF